MNSKYRVRQFVKKFLAFCRNSAFITVLTITRHFVETVRSLLCSQQPAILFYPGPDKSSPH
jgi:hypothetical protein